MIEKKYRNALNDRFDILRETLPEKFRTDCAGGLLSKGDVLSSARTYIKQLEDESEDLKSERRRLKYDIDRLEALWVESLEEGE